MKNLILVFIFLSVSLYAQTEEEKTYGGKYSLQFSIGSNFNLNSFDGSAFSGKLKFNEKLSLRGGISFFTLDEEREIFNEQIINDEETNLDTQKTENSQTQFRINTHLIWTVVNSSDIHFYIGGGPFVSFDNRKVVPNDSRSEDIEYEFYGIKLINGVEWYVKKNISLFAEYGLSFNYYKRNFYNESEYGSNTTEETSFHISSSNARLGVSLYF